MKALTISFVFACIIQSIYGKLMKSYDKSTFLDKTNTNVKVSWKYDVNDDMLFFGLEVKATGWVGFGFAHRIFKMKDYDVIVGRVESSGRGYFSDRHTIGQVEPWADLQQDYNMTYYEEVNGTTTFEFHRKRQTGDSKDIDIKLGPMWVVYAYHSTADYPSPYKSKHDHQGFKEVVILPLDTPLPRSVSSPPSLSISSQRNRTIVVTVIQSSPSSPPLSTKASVEASSSKVWQVNPTVGSLSLPLISSFMSSFSSSSSFSAPPPKPSSSVLLSSSPPPVSLTPLSSSSVSMIFPSPMMSSSSSSPPTTSSSLSSSSIISLASPSLSVVFVSSMMSSSASASASPPSSAAVTSIISLKSSSVSIIPSPMMSSSSSLLPPSSPSPPSPASSSSLSATSIISLLSTTLPSTLPSSSRSQRSSSSLQLLVTLSPTPSPLAPSMTLSALSSSLVISKTSSATTFFSTVLPDIPDYDKFVKVNLHVKVVSVEYEVIQDQKGPHFREFKNNFERNIAKRKKVWRVRITDIRKGSVIVDYEVLINTTSRQEVREVIGDIQQEVTSGKLGNFSVDPSYPMSAVITMKVESTRESQKVKQNKESEYLVTIIILGCAVGLLLILLIVTLFVCLRKRNQRTNAFTLKHLSYTNYDADD